MSGSKNGDASSSFGVHGNDLFGGLLLAEMAAPRSPSHCIYAGHLLLVCKGICSHCAFI